MRNASRSRFHRSCFRHSPTDDIPTRANTDSQKDNTLGNQPPNLPSPPNHKDKNEGSTLERENSNSGVILTRYKQCTDSPREDVIPTEGGTTSSPYSPRRIVAFF